MSFHFGDLSGNILFYSWMDLERSPENPISCFLGSVNFQRDFLVFFSKNK